MFSVENAFPFIELSKKYRCVTVLCTMAAKKRKNASNGNRAKTSNAGAGRAATTTSSMGTEKIASHSGGGIHQMTIYGAIILLCAIVSGLILNNSSSLMSRDYHNINNTNLTVDASFALFWEKVCDDDKNKPTTGAWCGDGKVEMTRRTLQASDTKTKSIRRGDIVAEIPRQLQIWEIDALRSDLVHKEKLLRARHKMTENPLASGAFLAAYLANEQKRLLTKKSETGYGEQDRDLDAEGVDDTHESYYSLLPSWEELSIHHPILKSKSDLQSLLGHHSWNFAVVAMYQEMINSEYEALTTASPLLFGQQISLKEYQTARIHVLSRSFNPGPNACSTESNKHFTPTDLERIRSDWGIQPSESIFKDGCHAMVPILDMLNSHPHPNVVYQYHSEKEAFVISAKTSISPGWELINSYGRYSDAHLFAKFGFVNGDGSGHSQVSIALFHRPLDVQISQEFTLIPNKVLKRKNIEKESFSPMESIPTFQKENLKRYLLYDDGYDNCIQMNLHSQAFKLKRLKWLHLAKIANNPKFWIATLGPRAPESRPRKSSDTLIVESPPEVNPQKLRMDITHLVDTCRLLALTVDDFEGNAIKLLNDNLQNDTFVVPKGSQALEYRSLMFLARMASTALMQYKVNTKKEYDNVRYLNRDNAFGNITWTGAHLRLAEMQSLQAVSGIAMTYARGILKDSNNEEMTTAFKMREKSCPREYTDILDE